MKVYNINSADILKGISSAVGKFAKVACEDTPTEDGCVFYRGMVYSTNDPNIVGIKFLISDIDGKFHIADADYYMEPYGKKGVTGLSVSSKWSGGGNRPVLFRDTVKVGEEFHNLLSSICSSGISTSIFYFDFPEEGESSPVQKLLAIDDANEPGSKILFASGSPMWYTSNGIIDAAKLGRYTCLTVDYFVLFKLLANAEGYKESKKDYYDRLMAKFKSVGITYIPD